jgi:hypothetical protein
MLLEFVCGCTDGLLPGIGGGTGLRSGCGLRSDSLIDDSAALSRSLNG